MRRGKGIGGLKGRGRKEWKGGERDECWEDRVESYKETIIGGGERIEANEDRRRHATKRLKVE